MADKVSVIIPVYNKEKYLDRCLRSIINQSYKGLEIIVIDDGSIDHSYKIIQEYKAIDNRIISVQQTNSGRSKARNKGIEIATGDYYCFIDADDTISDNYIELLLSTIKNKKADMAICEMNIISSDGSVRIANKLDNKSVKIDPNFIYSYISKSGGRLATSSCNKLYSAKLFQQHGLKYKDETIGEDFLLCIDALFQCSKIVTIDSALYNYYQNSDSTMHNFNEDYFNNIHNLMNTMYLMGEKNGNDMKISCACANVKNMFKIMTAKYENSSGLFSKINSINNVIDDEKIREYVAACNSRKLARNYKVVYFLYKYKMSLLLCILCSLYGRRSR